MKNYKSRIKESTLVFSAGNVGPGTIEDCEKKFSTEKAIPDWVTKKFHESKNLNRKIVKKFNEGFFKERDIDLQDIAVDIMLSDLNIDDLTVSDIQDNYGLDEDEAKAVLRHLDDEDLLSYAKEKRSIHESKLVEGQPLTARNSKPSEKRVLNNNVKNDKSYKYLTKALTDIGMYEENYKSSEYKRDSNSVSEVWLTGSNFYILSSPLRGTVKILNSGSVDIDFNNEYNNALSFSASKLLKRCGFKLSVKEVDNIMSDDSNKVYGEDVPYNAIKMIVSINKAAVMFNNLAKVLSKANESYSIAKNASKSENEYYTAKGKIAGDNKTVAFRISGADEYYSDCYVVGKLVKVNGKYSALLLEDEDYDEDYTEETLLDVCKRIVQYFDDFEFLNTSDALSGLDNFGPMPKDLNDAKDMLKTLVNNINHQIDLYNDKDDIYETYDNIRIKFDEPKESINSANYNRQKRVAKIQKQKAYDDAHRYESTFKLRKSIH